MNALMCPRCDEKFTLNSKHYIRTFATLLMNLRK